MIAGPIIGVIVIAAMCLMFLYAFVWMGTLAMQIITGRDPKWVKFFPMYEID